MKRFIFIIAFIIPSIVNAQERKVISLSFSANDFRFFSEEGVLYITSAKYNISFLTDTLAPALPLIGINVLVNREQEFSDLSYTSNEELLYSNTTLSTNPIEVPTNIRLNPKNRNKSSPFSSNHSVTAQYKHTSIMDGYKILHFLVSPFRYDADNHNLFLKKHIELNIILENKKAVSYIGSNGQNMTGWIENNIINYDDYDNLYGDYNLRTITDSIPYIIITEGSLKSSFQKLANWKTTKGVRAKVITTEEIFSNPSYNGTNEPMRIKKAIKDYYENHKTKYILLGGDINVVPTLHCYVHNLSYTTTTPCDWYYSCLETIDWDGNGNGLYGEFEDSVDIGPELNVTRLPVNSPLETNVMIDRIINYERNPSLYDWKDNILMAGSILSYYYYDNYGNRISDVQYKGDSLFNEHIAPIWNCLRDRLYDTDTDFPGGANFVLDSTNLQMVMSQGYSIIHMDTHGDTITWRLEKKKYNLNHSNAPFFYNPKNTIIVTSACCTNAFDATTTTCLSEDFMLNNNSGIIGYFGCSREGWYTFFKNYWGASNDYNIQFYNNLLASPSNHFGEAATYAKSTFINNCSTNNGYRWLLFGLNPLGDPEMPFHKSQPQLFNNIGIYYINDTLSISTGTTNTTICVMSSNDYGETFYKVISNCQQVTLEPNIDECTVCVTAPGYLPYITTAVNTTYIQNQTINSNLTIENGKTYIGRDVTNSINEGPVAIQSGHTSIKSSKGVMIKNNFTVNNGAKLTINQ